MKLRTMALAVSVLALTACGKGPEQNPEMLKGGQFITEMNGVNITLNFDPTDMRVYGKIVNNYNGAYQASGDKIEFGPFASTMMMGPEAAMKVEQNYFVFMDSAQTYELKDNTLSIKNANGQKITFKKLDTQAQ